MQGRSEIARLYTTFEECRFDHEGVDAWRARSPAKAGIRELADFP
jgi:hypothetical protein